MGALGGAFASLAVKRQAQKVAKKIRKARKMTLRSVVGRFHDGTGKINEPRRTRSITKVLVSVGSFV